MCPKCLKNKKKCLLRMFGKKLQNQKKFAPPLMTPRNFFAPPKTKNASKTIKCLLRTFGKKLTKSKKNRSPFGERHKKFALPFGSWQKIVAPLFALTDFARPLLFYRPQPVNNEPSLRLFYRPFST